MIIFSLAYFGCAVICSLLAFYPGPWGWFWLPSGLFVSVLVVNEQKYWPGLVLAAIPAGIAFHVASGQSLPVAAGLIGSNCVEAILGAWLVRRFVAEVPHFETVKEVSGFLITAAFLSPVISVTIGTAALTVLQGGQLFDWSMWLLWMAGDALGVLLWSPLLLCWKGTIRRSALWKITPRRMEGVLIVAIVLLVAVFVFWRDLHGLSIKYVILPLILWVATRFGIRGVSVANLTVAVIAAGFTLMGYSDISHSNLTIRGQVAALQFYIAMISTTGLLMAAVLSERQKAEVALMESVKLFHMAFDKSPLGGIIADLGGRFIRVNSEMVRILGYSQDELISKAFLDLTHPAYRENNKKLVDQLLAGEIDQYILDKQYIRKDGRTIWVHVSVGLARDAAGRPLYFFGAIEDITERKRVEAAFWDSEARLRLAQHAAGVGVWDWDILSGRLTWSKELAELFGRASSDSEGSLETWREVVHPDDREMALRKVQQAIEERSTMENEYRVRLPDGKVRWIHSKGNTIFTADGRPERMVGICIDITARKSAEIASQEAEQKFRNLAEESPNMIFINRMGRVVFANRLCSNIMKYGPEEFYADGFDFMSLIVPEQRNKVMDNFRRHISGLDVPPCEYTLLSRTGERIESIINTCLIDFEGGKAILGIVTVITERKRMEETLRESEARYRKLLVSTTDYIYTVRVEGGKAIETMHGHRCETVTGYRVEDYQADPFLWYRMISPDDRETVVAWAEKALQGDAPPPMEHRIIHKDGSLRWLRNTIVLHRTADGEVISYDGLVSDITQRKLAEEELRQVASLLKATLESTADGILVVDNRGSILNYNDRFVQMWKIPLTIMKFGDDAKALEFVLAQLKEPQLFLEKVRYLYANRDRESFDVLDFNDGRVFERYSLPLRIENEYLGRVWSFRDVSVRRHALQALREGEERFRELFSRMSSGVAVYEAVDDGEDFIFKDLNMAGQRISQVQREDVVNRRLIEVFPSVKTMGLFEVLQQVWRTGKPQSHPVSMYKDDRISLWVENQVYKLPSGEVVAVYEDVSERKKAEDALKLAKETAEASDRAKSEFLTNISHDFRTPLNAIAGFSSILSEVPLDERSRKMLGIIRDKSQSLLSMTGDLLEASGMKAGKAQLRSMAFDLQHLVKDAVEVARLEAAGKELQISSVFECELPHFWGDPIRLEQIVSNILTNAVKYTEKGFVEIRVSCSSPAADGRRQVQIAVKDSGLGIPADKQSRIFEPFTRFHEFAGGKRQKGVGLGLHIAKTMVNLMGGEICVNSEEGKGSEFVIILDLVAATEERSPHR